MAQQGLVVPDLGEEAEQRITASGQGLVDGEQPGQLGCRVQGWSEPLQGLFGTVAILRIWC